MQTCAQYRPVPWRRAQHCAHSYPLSRSVTCSPCRRGAPLHIVISYYCLGTRGVYEVRGAELTFKVLDHLWRNTQVSKHAGLLDHMLPGSRCSQTAQLPKQPAPHLCYAPTHRDQILSPLLVDLRILHDRLRHTRAVQRWRADGRALRIVQDTLHRGAKLRRRRHEHDGAGALAVKAHGLGKGQTHSGLHAQLLDKVADGPGVLVDAARVEAQVRRVEHGEKTAGADDVCNLAPLGARRVAAGGVVGARVQDDGRVGLCGAEAGEEVLGVKGAGGGVVVG